MLITVGCEISLSFQQPTAVTAMLYLHPSRSSTIIGAETLEVSPPMRVSDHLDLYGNRCARLLAPAGNITFRHAAVVHDTGLPDPQVFQAVQLPVHELPDHVMPYLLASRYCEVDSPLREIAAQWFANLQPGWSLVLAICNAVHRHIKFDYQQARANRSALETFQEAKGVCRDYMHLAITFCRIMNLPARYCTGYLGDIGVPVVPPPDFSAWFEVFLGGRWYAFDARNNKPRIGRVLMATGRDAADVALTTTFGHSRLERFTVWTDELPTFSAAGIQTS